MSEGVFLMCLEEDVFHIHLPLCHLVHLDFLTIRNKIVMNIHVQVLFFFILGINVGVGLLGHMVTQCLTF